MFVARCDTPGGPPCNPIVLGGPKRGPSIEMDEIPRRYPDFRTLPHYPEGMPRRGIPGIFDDFPGVPEFERYPRIPRQLPKLDPDFERYGPGAIMGNQPSVEQELGKLAGMFLGQFIQDRLGGR
tara:strand:+ start:295 stop:666 length:372 start_codon:yes stop_codon:yes gene_type:complete